MQNESRFEDIPELPEHESEDSNSFIIQTPPSMAIQDPVTKVLKKSVNDSTPKLFDND